MEQNIGSSLAAIVLHCVEMYIYSAGWGSWHRCFCIAEVSNDVQNGVFFLWPRIEREAETLSYHLVTIIMMIRDLRFGQADTDGGAFCYFCSFIFAWITSVHSQTAYFWSLFLNFPPLPCTFLPWTVSAEDGEERRHTSGCAASPWCSWNSDSTCFWQLLRRSRR